VPDTVVLVQQAASSQGMTEAGPSARKREALELFRGLPRHYDAVGAVMSFGQDPRWRRALVEAVAPAADDRVLDVATGTGMVAALLRWSAECNVVGLDQSDAMLARARERFAGDAAVELVLGEAERLPFGDGEFDALTFTYLLRYVDDPATTLRELARVVKPGGRIASLEFGVPPAALARGLWQLYTRLGLPVIGRIVSRDWQRVGGFLGPSITGFYADHPLERIVEHWREVGIENVRVRRLSFGAGVVMSGTRAAGTAADDVG
jgi:demethylmenaquinone methyltransferase/2-methoxy-6-polyprenyl-1,4-benzoquinol methylase